MKKIFLAVSSIAVLFNSTGCKKEIDATKLSPVFIYPRDGYASAHTITQSCPVETGVKPQKVDIASLQGWVCIPPEQAQKLRRAHEASCNQKVVMAQELVQPIDNFTEELNANTEFRIQETREP